MVDSSSIEPRVHHILCQIFIAFGQGAGGMHILLEAIAEASNAYAGPVARRQADWDTLAPPALEYAKGLGRLAAILALHDGRNVITAGDWREADSRFRRHRQAVYQECPFCLV